MAGSPTLDTLNGVWRVYLDSLRDDGPFLVVAAGVAWGLSTARVRALLARLPRPVRVAFGVALLIAALAYVRSLASFYDDAYISLRYARNLVRGHGLVFNPGERVEGYTNFLWTMYLAAGLALGADGRIVALAGNVVAFVLELLLVARMARRLAPAGERPDVPLAALLLGGSCAFATYGTTGMETMAATLLVTLALERALAEKAGQAGLCAILATMTHPDLALFYAGLGAALLFDREARRRLGWYAAPFVLLYVPYFLARWHYYGDFFPNTYYAKSADLSYFSQGIIYLTVCAFTAGVPAQLALGVEAISRRPRHLLTLFFLFACVPYLVYVAKIGGDFMLSRMIVPVLPVLALLAEAGWREVNAKGSPIVRAATAILLVLAVAPVNLIPTSARWDISNERSIYAIQAVWPRLRIYSPWAATARALADIAARGARPVVAVVPIGLIGYASDLPIVDIVGLTDPVTAHEHISRRGKPGHEKWASPQHLRARGVLLSEEPLEQGSEQPFTRVTIDGAAFYLTRWDPALVRVLRAIPGTKLPSPEADIDETIREAASLSKAALAERVAFWNRFYFAANGDPARQARLAELLEPRPR